MKAPAIGQGVFKNLDDSATISVKLVARQREKFAEVRVRWFVCLLALYQETVRVVLALDFNPGRLVADYIEDQLKSHPPHMRH